MNARDLRIKICNDNTDTPRTNVVIGHGDWVHCVDADFARGLERENAQLRELVKECHGVISNGESLEAGQGEYLADLTERLALALPPDNFPTEKPASKVSADYPVIAPGREPTAPSGADFPTETKGGAA